MKPSCCMCVLLPQNAHNNIELLFDLSCPTHSKKGMALSFPYPPPKKKKSKQDKHQLWSGGNGMQDYPRSHPILQVCFAPRPYDNANAEK